MITNLKIVPYPLQLAKPFSYATTTLNTLPYALVHIEQDGIIGYGEIAAAWDVTGETQSSAIGLYPHLWPILERHTIHSLPDIRTVMADIERHIAKNYTLKAGVEAALLDLLGKQQETSTLSFFASQPKPITSQTVISFEDFDAILSNRWTPHNLNALKVKCGRDFSQEKKVLEKLRELLPDVLLSIDVNQGWDSFEQAQRYSEELIPLHIAWIEQPLATHDIYGLKNLTRSSSIPIMLDESCGPLHEIITLMESACGTMVNIKLAKCGGLLAALDIFQWCANHKIPYMIGDMIHSQLGTVLNLYAGILGIPCAQDLTPLDRIAHDPSRGITLHEHSFILPSGKGLGIHMAL